MAEVTVPDSCCGFLPDRQDAPLGCGETLRLLYEINSRHFGFPA
jgi:hypothetical protein